MSITSWKKITIIKPLDFPAPDSVREALVGLTVKVYAKSKDEPKLGEVTQLVTGKPVTGYAGGYAVEQSELLLQLQKSDPSAYQWFVENKFPQQPFFAFRKDEVQECV